MTTMAIIATTHAHRPKTHSPVPLLLSSFPSPPTHIPASPLTPISPNPPPTRAPAMPLPPLPRSPSTISERDTLAFISSARMSTSSRSLRSLSNSTRAQDPSRSSFGSHRTSSSTLPLSPADSPPTPFSIQVSPVLAHFPCHPLPTDVCQNLTTMSVDEFATDTQSLVDVDLRDIPPPAHFNPTDDALPTSSTLTRHEALLIAAALAPSEPPPARAAAQAPDAVGTSEPRSWLGKALRARSKSRPRAASHADPDAEHDILPPSLSRAPTPPTRTLSLSRKKPLPPPPPLPAHPRAQRTASPDITDILSATPRPPRHFGSGGSGSTTPRSAPGSRPSSSRTSSLASLAYLRRSTGSGTGSSTSRPPSDPASDAWPDDADTSMVSDYGVPVAQQAGGYALGGVCDEMGVLVGDGDGDGNGYGDVGLGALANAEGGGSDSDSSLDLHTPLPHMMLRAGVLSPHSKILSQPSAASPVDSRPPSVASHMSSRTTITKAGVFKDERDTARRRTRHRDGKLLRDGLGLTTGLGWSDSEDEDAPSALTHRLSSLALSRRSSAASLSAPMSMTMSMSASHTFPHSLSHARSFQPGAPRSAASVHPLVRAQSAAALARAGVEPVSAPPYPHAQVEGEGMGKGGSGSGGRVVVLDDAPAPRRRKGSAGAMMGGGGGGTGAPPTSWGMQGRSARVPSSGAASLASGSKSASGSMDGRASTSSRGSTFSMKISGPEDVEGGGGGAGRGREGDKSPTPTVWSSSATSSSGASPAFPATPVDLVPEVTEDEGCGGQEGRRMGELERERARARVDSLIAGGLRACAADADYSELRAKTPTAAAFKASASARARSVSATTPTTMTMTTTTTAPPSGMRTPHTSSFAVAPGMERRELGTPRPLQLPALSQHKMQPGQPVPKPGALLSYNRQLHDQQRMRAATAPTGPGVGGAFGFAGKHARSAGAGAGAGGTGAAAGTLRVLPQPRTGTGMAYRKSSGASSLGVSAAAAAARRTAEAERSPSRMRMVSARAGVGAGTAVAF